MIKLNGVEVIPTIFPDNTSQVWKLPEGLIKKGDNEVVWDFEHEGEIMHLMQLRDLIGSCNLYMPYLPYARQDKAVSNDKTFALSCFIQLLNFIGFNKVTAFDVHNPAPIKDYMPYRFENIEPVNEIQNAIDTCLPDKICFPDKGAQDRYSSIIPFIPTIYANKKRDQVTGEIIGLELVGYPSWSSVLIVDDICDGGMTFIKLAELLYSKGATEVHLYVSHGIFSKGLQVLRDAGIRRIFTKDGEV